MTSFFWFCTISFIASAIDVTIGAFSLMKKNAIGRQLSLISFGSAAVTVFYLFSTTCFSYYDFSLTSAFYFASVTFVLIFFFKFTLVYTEYDSVKWLRVLFWFMMLWGYADICVQLSNPFSEIAISYVPRSTAIAPFSYQMHFLYNVHLVFAYITIAIISGLLIRKSFSVPSEYKHQYRIIMLAVILIVLANALFLFVSDSGHWELDFSIWGYCIGIVIIYWCAFDYKQIYMNRYFRSIVLDSINQGVVVFDYSDKFYMMNAKANELLSVIDDRKIHTFDEFCSVYNLSSSAEPEYDDKPLTTINYYNTASVGEHAIKYEYKPLTGKNHVRIGRLMVLSNSFPDVDALTGFASLASFKSRIEKHGFRVDGPLSVAVFDINNLRYINSQLGIQKGDQVIRDTAKVIKHLAPEASLLIRGLEAELIILQINAVHETFAEKIHDIAAVLQQRMIDNTPYSVQYATSSTDDGSNGGFYRALHNAVSSLREKKLLDKSSPSSNLISSLTKALESCDSDTEEHVSRTRKLGEQLADRLHLSDLEKSELSLLCLLHDIGKITIPLEILNKPGPLTEAERIIMNTHAEKGSLIAACTPELASVADMIKHHHESWDGKGYPDGLSGNDIPLLSRIIAVVDAYDAMVNDRPYRKAMSNSAAITELRRCAETQFDPYIVQEFTAMIDTDA